MPLLPRELEVLRIIVEDFIQNAEPVGSRTVAKLFAQHLSPASMRNTMADLTDQGFLTQPHTSAGRVPTLKAFRFYLDTALRPHPLAESHRQRIMGQLASVKLGLPDLLQEASNILSSMSHQVSMVIAPSRNDVRWREIDFNLVNSGWCWSFSFSKAAWCSTSWSRCRRT